METVLSAQFCYEPKTILLKSLFKNKTKMNNKAFHVTGTENLLTTLFYCKEYINNSLLYKQDVCSDF